MAYGDLKDLNRRAAADEICDKALNFTWTCFSRLSFDIKTSGGRVTNENIFNKEFVNELLKFNKKSTFTFYRQHLVCRSSRYAIDKFI